MDTIDSTLQIEEVAQSLTDLEGALSQSDRVSAATTETVTKLLKLVKSCRRALAGGDLKSLHRGLDSLPDQLEKVGESIDALRRSWSHTESDEERYFASGSYTRELMAVAREAGLSLSEQEGVLACYPSLLKVNARERGMIVDRKLSREVRPSKLVEKLAENQKRPSNLKTGPFIAALHSAYRQLCGKPSGEMVKLLDIYDAWSLRPGSKREYSLQEFTRDIYLLDASGVKQTSDGIPFRLHAGATASKNRSNLLVLVTREGAERTYYSIEFL